MTSKFPLVTDSKVVDLLVEAKCSTTIRISRELHDLYLGETIREGLPESVLSDDEKRKVESLGLRFKGPTYLARAHCPCGRRLNSYDFLMTGIYQHGIDRIRSIFNSEDIIAQVNPVLDYLICSESLHKVPFSQPDLDLAASKRKYFWTLLYGCVETSSVKIDTPGSIEDRVTQAIKLSTRRLEVMIDGIVARLERLEGR